MDEPIKRLINDDLFYYNLFSMDGILKNTYWEGSRKPVINPVALMNIISKNMHLPSHGLTK